jgi:hypothetical protein
MDEILKLKLMKRDLYGYVLKCINGDRNVRYKSASFKPSKQIIFCRQSSISKNYWLTANGWIAWIYRYDSNPDIFNNGRVTNFPGPKDFEIKLKEFNTKQEFIDNYIFEEGKNNVVMHFNLDTRKFVLKEVR